MNEPFASSEMLSDIRANCITCMGGNKRDICESRQCVFYKYRTSYLQLNLFGTNYKGVWISEALALALEKFSWFEFFPSEFYCEMEKRMPAVHKNWYGCLFGCGGALRVHGFKLCTTDEGSYITRPIPAIVNKKAKGRSEKKWKKVA